MAFNNDYQVETCLRCHGCQQFNIPNTRKTRIMMLYIFYKKIQVDQFANLGLWRMLMFT